MPNFQLSRDVRDNMRSRAYSALTRVVLYAMARCPLTTVQIQKGVLTPYNLELLTSLTEKGNTQQFLTVPKYHSVTLLLDRSTLPYLTRSLALKVQLPRHIWLAKTTWLHSLHGAGSALLPTDSEATLFDPGTALDALETSELVTWANEALRQHRLVALARKTLLAVTDDLVPTTAHLRARWPFLATLIDDRGWRDKVNTQTRGMMRYEMLPADQVKHAKRMALAEVMITQGELLAEFMVDKSKPVVDVAWWEALPNDVLE